MTPEEIQKRMDRADRSFNAFDISVAMFDMMKEDGSLTFADFETALRAIDSETYLIARPNARKPRDFDVMWLQKRDGQPEHHLWVCLHGSDERDNELEVADMTMPENLVALQETCGVLAVKRPRHS